jgi:hypothetical protein
MRTLVFKMLCLSDIFLSRRHFMIATIGAAATAVAAAARATATTNTTIK